MTRKTNAVKSERILDVAEELFARHGYDGVTMRQISTGAKVDVALANYHFGKKLDVFYAVFNRRAEHLGSTRRQVLQEQFTDGEPQRLEQVIEAFLLPLKLAQESGDPGWKNYMALLAYVMTSPVWSREMMENTFDKHVGDFIAALRQIFPTARDEDLHWCYHYVSGALALTLAQTGRIDRLSGGKCLSSDFDAAYDRMIPFMAAGFRAVCGEERTPQ
ncbi:MULTISPECIES: TetR/AcrR family transcriptional regulator [Spongiibacter]|jgi:AcrR family transcriptional regulator|uniref:TetR/AcrR family transcriptional regulator n=1 Tax=Spongiibacter TaxID=630749 RepID=UPI00055EDD3D|nr:MULTISPECIES: TetR/AcrR family transcriptional regulator [Spongiibacter]MBM7423287.1 AcrR family transcriptional regulator [Spongiibacter marinus]|tara:strand:- start:3081 stop:3734 length:654 start_codon:yes stop_codon:yes gene_type:complete